MRVQTAGRDTIGVTRLFNPGKGCVQIDLSDFSNVRIHLTDQERIELALQVLSGGCAVDISEALARDPSGQNLLRLLVETSEKYVRCPACGAVTNRRERKTCSGCSRFLEGM